MLDVIIRLGETVFQSSEVKGAVCSGVFEFERSASGVSLLAGRSRPWLAERVMEFPGDAIGVSEGRDHSLRWSPDVARRSVDCFWDDGGSHKRRVTGYECVASAIFMNSSPYFGAPGVYDSGGVGVICESRI